MTKASTTQRNVGIRAISCIKTAKPRLNRVSASYAEAEKPTAACLIQMVPKTKKLEQKGSLAPIPPMISAVRF